MFRRSLLLAAFALGWAAACSPARAPAEAEPAEAEPVEPEPVDTEPALAHPDWPEIQQWVRDSFPDAPRMTVDELRARLADEEAPRPLLLDTRTPEEYAVSHLPGARLAPDAETALALIEDRPDDAPVVLYCSVAYRSGRLTEELRAQGVENLFNLEGSIFEWANRGLPLENADGPTDRAHPYDEEWGRLLRSELRATSVGER